MAYDGKGESLPPRLGDAVGNSKQQLLCAYGKEYVV